MPAPRSTVPVTLGAEFYDRPVVEVARDLIGCVVRHGQTSGMIVETEAYHQTEPACHAFTGLSARTRTLFGPPAHAYVYLSYGIHELLNAVCEPEGTGAAVLIRALEPLTGLELMARRRRLPETRVRELCSGPGKLAQALGVGLVHNGCDLTAGPLTIEPRVPDAPSPAVSASTRIGITKAVELPWRFCAAGSGHLSKPAVRPIAGR